MQQYLERLQAVPERVMTEVVNGLLEQFRETVGEDVGSGSILDLDFNYKHVFTEHIKAVYQDVKKSAVESRNHKEAMRVLEEKIASKDKDIEELVDSYESSLEQLRQENE